MSTADSLYKYVCGINVVAIIDITHEYMFFAINIFYAIYNVNQGIIAIITSVVIQW